MCAVFLTHLLFLVGCGCNDLEKKILDAARKGDHITVKKYLDQGIEPGMSCWAANCGRLGCTISLIREAVASGSWETVQLLIEDPGIKNNALFLAILNENLALAKQLVAAGAQFAAHNSYSNIHSALNMNDLKAGEEMFNFVMGLGADINDKSPAGVTIVKFLLENEAHKRDDGSEYAEHRKKIFQRNIRLVFSRNPDLNLPSPVETVLMYAACLREKDYMAMLLQHGADPNIQDKNGTTALISALGCAKKDDDYVAAIKILHEYKADINTPNHAGETGLMLAAYHCGPATVKKLLDLGAHINARDSDGESALFKAVRGELNNLIKHTNLKEDARCGIIRQMANYGADINTPNSAGMSPLAIARQKNLMKIAAALQSLGGKDIRPPEKNK